MLPPVAGFVKASALPQQPPVTRHDEPSFAAAQKPRYRRRLLIDPKSDQFVPPSMPKRNVSARGRDPKRPSLNTKAGQKAELRNKTQKVVVANRPTDVANNEAGRLMSERSDKHLIALVINVGLTPLWIGRHPRADWVIHDPTISAWHCRIYAVRVDYHLSTLGTEISPQIETDTGEKLVCLEDQSVNGVEYNGRRIVKTTTILCHQDVIVVGKTVFKYMHTAKPGRWQPGDQALCPSDAKFSTFVMGDYQITERALGSGFFSVVHMSINVKTHQQAACKIVRKRIHNNVSTNTVQMMREIKLNAELIHPNINKIIDFKEDTDNIYLFLNLVTGGDLYGYIIRHRSLVSAEAKFILYQILKALEYMHDENQVSHRDLKPENILLSGHGPYPHVLVADFGCARHADRAFSSISGTMSYTAPEVLSVYTREKGYDGKKADMWAIGVCTYIMLIGHHPFDMGKEGVVSDLDAKVATELCDSDRPYVSAVLNPMSSVAILNRVGDPIPRDFLKQVINVDPVTRLSASQALRHHWISKSKQELDLLYQQVVSPSTSKV